MTSGFPTTIYQTPRLPMGRRPRPGEASQVRQRSRRSRNPGRYYTLTNPAQFQLGEFAHVDNLHAAFRKLERDGGHGAGIDGLSFEDFSPGAVFDALRHVSAAILNHQYCPYDTRLARVPKGEGRFRELRLQRVTDRAVAKALQLALTPVWRPRLPRIGRSVMHIFAEMQQVIRERQAYVLAIDDIRDCFPSAPIDGVFDYHRDYISQPDLLWLIEQILRGHEGPLHMIGLDQGSPYSPIAMELLLHACLDTELETRCQGYPLLLRYVDNLTFVCTSEREGQEILQVTEEILAPQGLTLKKQDGIPQDIRDPEFNTTVLGLTPYWQDGQLKFKIPESTYEDLTQGFINAMNQAKPTLTAELVAKGWMEAMGPALTKSVTSEVIDRILTISRRCGFREISQRELRETASKARRRWIRISESCR